MQIGRWLLTKYEGKIVRGIVVNFFIEDLDMELENKIVIRRKYWEVRSAPYDNEKEEK